ncbi:class I SAM-dependent methyltransferase [Frigoriglobus tundricola]|uniref:SAM-dependent methyltransferase n=1 Tax=Frigoriglobus tundricola TaxID=2774151 RepID=A0A6M5YF92_9BACT|nr:SAM-dependent methyltransferase [Frigoriglobus tundricola]QJW92648.1 SAM-dependent methyltransferase [Frigoriglobus tundricola]
MQTNPTRTELLQYVKDAVTGDEFSRATFAGATRGSACEWVRVVVRPVELRGARQVQFAYQGAKKVVTRNFPLNEVEPPLDELLGHGFAGVHISLRTEEIDIRTSRKGRVHFGRRKMGEPREAVVEPHNRVKDVPLPEGRADRLLEVMGIATPDGHVRASMRAKFTQINEFLKQLRHALDGTDLERLGRPVEILDCGCGSSYLTLAAHHYLNNVLGVPARVLGVDVNDEVIRKSTDRADRLGATGLNFECRRIGTTEIAADIVLALHACDTATDDALAQAVRSDARLLLSVPCCHHDLNRALQPGAGAGVLRPVLRHGIMLQRTADLVTDAFRALALRIMGYRTDVVEFVATEHTPRNLMIRAVRGGPLGAAVKPGFAGDRPRGPEEAAHIAEYIEMKRFWGVTPYIEKAFGEPFQNLVTARPL